MKDLISRQAAIDAIYEHEFSNWCDKDEVSTILNDLPPAEPKWVSCSERLPDYEEDVLTCYATAGIIEIQCLKRHIGNDHWENSHGDWQDLVGVVAWMPLPEPYRGESE